MKSPETEKEKNDVVVYNHTLDHMDSRYYKINDYYNMESGNGLHILSHFQTYQQSTPYSCGSIAALMVLNRYGNHDYSEMEICRLAGTDTAKGTGVEGLVSFFNSLGWETTYHADSALRFQSMEECEDFFISTIDSGTPILINWVDWVGHWQVLIGLDTCGTDDVLDDVLIMADPCDITDHYQDGYYIVPMGRFFTMWREGPCAEKSEPYQQPFVIAVPGKNSEND